MKYDLVLATTDALPPATSQVEVEAPTRKKAVDIALAMDFDDLEWFLDNGEPIDWQDVSSNGNDVVVAE